ncbi:MAG: hypothetical protein ABSC22_05655 [Roseiarcus sp.]|jgi:hypothetical protein
MSLTQEERAADSPFDTLVPDPQVAKELNKTTMTFFRWDNNPRMAPPGWPPKIKIGRLNHRSRRKLEAMKALLDEAAMKARLAGEKVG